VLGRVGYGKSITELRSVSRTIDGDTEIENFLEPLRAHRANRAARRDAPVGVAHSNRRLVTIGRRHA